MTAITFDTLKYANRLKAAGIDPKHAEAEAEALSEVFGINLQTIATKDDIRQLEREIKLVEERLTEGFDAKLIQLEQHMTIKLGTLMVIAVSVVATLDKAL